MKIHYVYQFIVFPWWSIQQRSCLRRQRGGCDPWVGEDPLEKKMATCSSILVWKIPWTEKLGGLQSMGLQKLRHDWSTEHTHTHWHTSSSTSLWRQSVSTNQNSFQVERIQKSRLTPEQELGRAFNPPKDVWTPSWFSALRQQGALSAVHSCISRAHLVPDTD